MNNDEWLEFAAAICDDAGIAYGQIEMITTWDQKFCDDCGYRNNAVFRIGGQRCLKVYGPTSDRQFDVEHTVLRTLARDAAIPAPRCIVAKARAQYPPYLIMTEAAGITLEDQWEALSRPELMKLAREIGTITAAVHRLPHENLAKVEQQYGGRAAYVKQMQEDRITEIEQIEIFSTRHKDDLLHFLFGDALVFLDGPPKLTHSDFSHAHVYVNRQQGEAQVSGFIDWGEAMLGPAEWDTAFHWFWTFSWDREAMRECLKALYPNERLPERFARRCFATHLYSYSISELWGYIAKNAVASDSIVHDLTAFFFPQEVFGEPD